MKVCAVCGVETVQNRTGRWIHVDAIPRGIDPEHMAEPIDREDYALAQAAGQNLRDALMAMLRHHDTLCPGCEFRKVARRALGMPET